MDNDIILNKKQLYAFDVYRISNVASIPLGTVTAEFETFPLTEDCLKYLMNDKKLWPTGYKTKLKSWVLAPEFPLILVEDSLAINDKTYYITVSGIRKI